VMASSVYRRIESDLLWVKGQCDPVSLIRSRSTVPIRACGLSRISRPDTCRKATDPPCEKNPLPAGGHPHRSQRRRASADGTVKLFCQLTITSIMSLRENEVEMSQEKHSRHAVLSETTTFDRNSGDL
jgi:hypothetical protein